MSIDIVLMRYTGQFSNINGNVNIADYYRCGCRWSMVFLNHSNIPWKKRATPNTIKSRTRQRPNKKKSVHLLHTHRAIVVTITIRRKMHAQNARCKRLNQPTIVIYFPFRLFALSSPPFYSFHFTQNQLIIMMILNAVAVRIRRWYSTASTAYMLIFLLISYFST